MTHGPTGSVAWRKREGMVGLAGLVSCGSVWACTMCNAKIAMSRRLEVGAVAAGALAAGHSLGFLTFTMRHHQGHGLVALWDALSTAWDMTTGGSHRPWAADRRGFGIAGWVRTVEVTWGLNGWHVHIHVVVLLDGSCGQVEVDALGASMFRRWSASLVRSGLDAPLPIGQAFKLVTGSNAAESLAEYFTKMAGGQEVGTVDRLGLEMTYSQSKRARSGHSTVTPWELLAGVVDDGDAAALKLWHEYELGSHGRRQITWSRGLRDRFALAPEQSDQDLAAVEVGSDADTVLMTPAAGWAVLVAHPSWIAEALDVLQVAGVLALSTYLAQRGVAHSLT